MFYRNSGFATKDFKKIREVFLQIFVPFKTYILFFYGTLNGNIKLYLSLMGVNMTKEYFKEKYGSMEEYLKVINADNLRIIKANCLRYVD